MKSFTGIDEMFYWYLSFFAGKIINFCPGFLWKFVIDLQNQTWNLSSKRNSYSLQWISCGRSGDLLQILLEVKLTYDPVCLLVGPLAWRRSVDNWYWRNWQSLLTLLSLTGFDEIVNEMVLVKSITKETSKKTTLFFHCVQGRSNMYIKVYNLYINLS